LVNRDPKVVLGTVILVLLTATALWGVLTYELERSPSIISPATGSPEARRVWGPGAALVVALLLGHVSGRYLAQQHLLSIGWWAVMAAGVIGFSVGGILPWPACWRWGGINLIGSLSVSLLMAVGVGRICACSSSKKED
jgi:hypothetical protein